MDYFQCLFLAGAGLLVLVRSIRGWRMGVVRQLVDLAALGLAYGTAILAARLAPHYLRSLDYPDVLLSVIAGSISGGVVYVGLGGLGSKLCGRTRDQNLGLARLGYGAGGSILGAMSAVFTVWMFVLGIRCLGTVAEAEVAMARSVYVGHPAFNPGPMAEGLARFKQSLDTGPVGAMMQETDPVPDRIYAILTKITQVVSSVDSMRRFASFPGTKELSQNPRIIALQKDPQIAQLASKGNVMALLGNPKIAAAVNDPKLEGMVKSFALEKALDYALCSSGKTGGN
jgi:hypothetical protein